MVINDFDVLGAVPIPNETDTILVIDFNRMLAAAIILQRLQPVAGRRAKISKTLAASTISSFRLATRSNCRQAGSPDVPEKRS